MHSVPRPLARERDRDRAPRAERRVEQRADRRDRERHEQQDLALALPIRLGAEDRHARDPRRLARDLRAHAVDDRLDLVAEVLLEQQVDREHAPVARHEAVRRDPIAREQLGHAARARDRPARGARGQRGVEAQVAVRVGADHGHGGEAVDAPHAAHAARAAPRARRRARAARGSNGRSLSSATTRISSPPYAARLSR